MNFTAVRGKEKNALPLASKLMLVVLMGVERKRVAVSVSVCNTSLATPASRLERPQHAHFTAKASVSTVMKL